MASASDPELWDYALKNDYTIVSKDDDFHHLSFLRGSPPKVIGIGIGNCSTDTIEILLRNSLPSILAFEADPQASFHRLP
jgi:predicted nuclease of predicted toxin-antitoxin system